MYMYYSVVITVLMDCDMLKTCVIFDF